MKKSDKIMLAIYIVIGIIKQMTQAKPYIPQ